MSDGGKSDRSKDNTPLRNEDGQPPQSGYAELIGYKLRSRARRTTNSLHSLRRRHASILER